jgi:phosphoribosylformylglycinamidine synthase
VLLARIIVTPRPVLNDPQGRAVHRALETLGFDEVEDVRVGKYLEVSLDLESRARAEARVHEMCERLLANQVIEDYRYEIAEARAPETSDAHAG